LRRAGGSFRGVSGCGVVPAGIKWDSRRRRMGYVMLSDEGGVRNRRRVATTSAVIFLCVTICVTHGSSCTAFLGSLEVIMEGKGI
jgi:hypothetical protein